MKGWNPQRRQSLAAMLIAAALITAGVFLFGPRLLDVVRRSPDSASRRTAADRDGDARRPFERPGAMLAKMEEIDRDSVLVRADSGAILRSAGGAARVEIPPHALRRDQRVDLVRFAVEGEDATGPFAFDLQPDGLQLLRPARLRLKLPLGYAPEELEIAVFDLSSGRWIAEADQQTTAAGDELLARLSHFSLRRIRIRPGLNFPQQPQRGRATFYLESDAGNTFERYVEGRWRAVRRRTPSYRELMRIGRLGRLKLISSGRLRAITAARPEPTVFLDGRRTAAMPPGSAEGLTGWARVRRLDAQGRPTGDQVIVRVNDYGPGRAPRRAGVIIDLSRSAMEALGLRWGEHFGLAEGNPDLAWIRVPREDAAPLRYLPVTVDAYEPQPARAPTCRLW